MSFIPLTGPAVLMTAERPREGEILFSDERRSVPLPLVSAIPVLTKALATEAVHPSVGLLGAASLFALKLVAAGKIEETTIAGQAVWAPVVVGPDMESLRVLAEFRTYDGVDAEAAERLIWAMIAAVVDSTISGSSGTKIARSSSSAVASTATRAAIEQARVADRDRAPVRRETGRIVDRLQHRVLTEDKPGTPTKVSISLRVEADEESLVEGVVRLALQVHDAENPLHLVDGSVLWRDDPREHGFGMNARSQVAARLGDACRVWPPLTRMRFQASPTELILEGDDIGSLLSEGVAALKTIGVDVMWPRSLGRSLTAHAVVERESSRPVSSREEALSTGLFSQSDLFSFKWQIAVGDEDLTETEMEELAQATSPLLKLRGSWTVVDPGIARKASKRLLRRATPVEALSVALAGVADLGDETGGPAPVIVGASLERLRTLVAEVGTGDLHEQPAALDATLREYQRRGMTWLANLTDLGLGGCLADDMGLGKTVTLIALHLHRRQRRAGTGLTLVVCPTSLMGNWEAELAKFAPEVSVARFHGSARSVAALQLQAQGVAADGAGMVVLTTYGTMRRDARQLAGLGWDLVVADEAQNLKNPGSATARSIRQIESTARIALTGTPVENDLSELWAILDWCVPGLLGSRKAFRKAWAAPIEAGVTVAARQFADLVAPFMLRRRKSDPGIAPELPPKTETDRVLSLTKEQTVLYESFVRDTMERIERLPADDPHRRGLVLMLLTGLKQICNHPAQFLKQSGGKVSGRSHKLDALDQIVETALAADGAVLVFTQYVAMARLIQTHWESIGIDHQFLHGGTSVAERDRMVAKFQRPDRSGPRVFLLSLQAGGTGLNLTAADHVVHIDRWWNPAVEDQASDRAWRIGQTKPVQVHRLVTKGTLEERIALLLEKKRALAEAVLGRGEAALTELNNAELRSLVMLDRDGIATATRRAPGPDELAEDDGELRPSKKWR